MYIRLSISRAALL